MYESSSRDALTGVANRKSFDERLSAELAFAQRHNFAAETVEHQGRSLCVTASIGVASLSCCGAGRDKPTLIALTDARLYRAKQLGRDRAVSA